MAGPNDPVNISGAATMHPPLTSTDGLPDVPNAVTGAMERPSLSPASGRSGAMPGYDPANPVGIPGLVIPGSAGGVGGGGPIDPAALQRGAMSVADSMRNYVSSLPNTQPMVAQNAAGNQLEAAGKQAVNQAQVEAAIRLQADNAKVAAAFGFTPGASDGTIAAFSKQIADNETALDQKKSEILQKQGLSFFDDPVQWLFNQVALPYDIAEFNTRVSTSEHKLDVLKKMEEATLEGYKINAGVDVAASSVLLKGMNDQAAATALQESSKFGLQAAQLGVSETSVRMTATMDGFNAAVAANSQLIQLQHLDIAQKGIAISEQNLDLAKIHSKLEEESADRAKQMGAIELQRQTLALGSDQDKQKSLTELNDRLLRASTVLKVNPVTWQQLQVMGDGPQKEFWMRAISDPNIQESGRLGFDATNALATANNFNLPMTPGINIVREKLINIRDNVIAPQQLTWKTLSPDSQHLQIQTAISSAVTREAHNIPDQGGIFSPGTLSSTLSIGQGEASLANTKIGAALAPAAKADPNMATRADMIISTASQLIQAGKATPSEMAAEIKRIYTSILVDNNNQRQYGLMGLKALDPNVEGYNTIVSMGGYGNSKPVNLTSQAQIEALLTRKAIQQNLEQLRGGVAGGL